MKVSVRVPATIANIGPGFDCLGIAIPLYNTITIEETVLPGTGVEINVLANDDVTDELSLEHMPMDENSIIYKAVELLYNSIGQTPSELKITIHSEIPIAKGLGSSASVIVGGLLAANKLLGEPADETALLAIATEVEGHPDNVAPAIYGGFTISFQEDGVAHTLRTIPKMPLLFIAVVPDMQLSTHMAREAIPKVIAHTDAVFNASRTALLTAALLEDRPELLQYALEDKLHQPYRAKLIPGLPEVFAAGKAAGAYQCIISGSGSTLLAYAPPEKDGNAIGKAMVDAFAACGQKAVYHILELNTKGTEVLRVE